MHPFPTHGRSFCPPVLDASLPDHMRSATAFAADLECTTASTLHMSLSDDLPSTKAPAMLSLPFLRGPMALSPSVAARPVVTATSATATSTIRAVAPSPLTPSLGLWPDMSGGDLGSGLGSGLFAPDFGAFNDYSPDMSNSPRPHPASGPSSTTDLDSDELEQLSPFYPADGASPIAMPGQAPAHTKAPAHPSEMMDPPMPNDSCLFASLPPPAAPEPMPAHSYNETTPHLLPSAPIYKPHNLSRGRTSLAGAFGSPFSAPSMSPVPSGPSTSPVPSGLSMSPTSGLSSPEGVLGRHLDSFASIPWGNDVWQGSNMAPSTRNMGMEQPYSVSLGSSLQAIPPPALLPGPNRASVRPPATSGPSGLSMAFNPSATAFSPLPNTSVTNSFSPSATPAFPPGPTPFPAIYASGLPTAMDANPPPAFLPDSVAPQTLEQESPPVPGGMTSLMSRLDMGPSSFGQLPPSSPSMSSSALSSASAQSPHLSPSPLGSQGRHTGPIPAHTEEELFGTSVPAITPREAAQSYALTTAVVLGEPMARSLPPNLGATGTGSRRRVEVDPVTGIITRPTRGRAVPTNLEDMAHLGKLGKGGRVWACKVPGCSKMFRRSEHLNRHLRSIHSEARPFKCPFDGCNKYFSRRDNLNQHQRVHTLDKAARRRRSSTISRGRLSPLADA